MWMLRHESTHLVGFKSDSTAHFAHHNSEAMTKEELLY